MIIQKRIIKRIILFTPLKPYFDERILPKQISLFFVNWFVQRLIGLNKKVPFLVHFTSQFVRPDQIVIGKRSWTSFFLSGGIYIQAANGVTIGNDCLIAPGVKIISANHDPSDPERKWIKDTPIHIGSNCWIGTNAVILPGVVIGDRSVIGAGAVVTQDVPNDTVVVGNPARIIRCILKDDQ